MSRPVAVVTGANGALGQVVARQLKDEGYDVAGIDVGSPSTAPDALTMMVGSVDLSQPQSTNDAFAQIQAQLGAIAGLVNVAGGFTWQTVMDGDVEAWDRMFTINVKTALNACRAAVPLMTVPGAAIVNIGANAALKADLGMAPYAVSKSGVARLTESLAVELKGKVRVNAILPSIIDTPANRADMPDADFTAWVTAQELANVAGFLLSGKASGITGALIPVIGRV